MRDPSQSYLRALYPQDDQSIPSSRVIVIHCLEAPNKVGLARSLQSGWMRDPAEQTSAHTITDAGETVQDMDYSLVCWHCGNGNQHSTGREQVGYAEWSVAQWNAPDMDPVLRNLALSIAWEWVHRVIPDYSAPRYPQWLSLAQLAAGATPGLATHNDARLVWGGTTHWDPGPNYPFGKLLTYVHQEIDKLLGATPVIKVDGASHSEPRAPSAPPTLDRNLLEFIMTLPGTPAGVTYDRLINDIANIVLAQLPLSEHDRAVAANNVGHGLNADGGKH